MPNHNATHANSWIHARNPLTAEIPHFADMETLATAIAFDPLAGINVRDLDLATRVGLLAGEKTPLQPTSVSLQCGLVWQGMLLSGLNRRNPLLKDARRNYWNTLTQVGRTQNVPMPQPTKGMAIHVAKGPTGTGKSVTADRFCSMYPVQVIEHGECPGAGWKHMLQLVYLQVDMSSDGSRGGFLTGILLQMDHVLGTSYASSLRKQFKTVDPLMAATISRLIAHFAGILFIDEGQLRNLVKCGQADLIQLFLLQLMNSGIPIVFVGNERAFDWIEYSQDLSRLNLVPCARFSPPGSLVPGDLAAAVTAHERARANADWMMIIDGVMSYYLLRERSQQPEECARLLGNCSGRIARLALTLWSTAQMQALLVHGREYVVPNDILQAYNSVDFDELRSLADGFTYQKPELLSNYPDVASAFYAKIWGVSDSGGSKNPTKDGNDDSSSQTPAAPEKPRRKSGQRSEKSKFAAEQTRKANQDKQREQLKGSLKPEDMRQQGLTKHHMAGLESLRAAASQKG